MSGFCFVAVSFFARNKTTKTYRRLGAREEDQGLPDHQGGRDDEACGSCGVGKRKREGQRERRSEGAKGE